MRLKKLRPLALALPLSLGMASLAMANAPVGVTAPMAIVIDYHTGEVLYERDAHRRAIPASITKNVAAFVVFEAIEDGRLSLDTRIPVSQHAANVSRNHGGLQGSTVIFNAGETVTVEHLLQWMMLPSANAASVIFGEYLYGSDSAMVERMNEALYTRGLYSSFTNSHGAAPHHTDVYSMGRLVHEFVERFPEVLRITAMQRPAVNREGGQFSTNRLITNVAGQGMAGVDGFKTGNIRQSGWGHTVTATRDGHRVIVALMGTTSLNNSMYDAQRLVNFGFGEINRLSTERAQRVNHVRLAGEVVELPADQPAMIYRGQLMLPLAWLGSYVSNHGNVQLTSPHASVNVHMGRTTASANGQTIYFDLALLPANGTIYASLDFFAQALDSLVSWNPDAGVVIFTPMPSVNGE